MTEHLETRRCPECGSQEFYWHFDAPDGWALIAVLPVIPDMSGIEAAKMKALAEHDKERADS